MIVVVVPESVCIDEVVVAAHTFVVEATFVNVPVVGRCIAGGQLEQGDVVFCHLTGTEGRGMCLVVAIVLDRPSQDEQGSVMFCHMVDIEDCSMTLVLVTVLDPPSQDEQGNVRLIKIVVGLAASCTVVVIGS